ncbi:hypothetical protein ACR78Z_20835 [Sphingobacterium thalpophilum]|uniref:hypothetical protein n=1 Tax=Sphingobacterium thalpophilum TaxID=259 RepID=UPI003DA61E80
MLIKVGYLLSYDYQYIITSLRQVYKEADSISISYDANKRTWTGNTFELPDSIFEEIKQLDRDNKIKFFAENFYLEGQAPLELETRQRNMLAHFMGEGGWHIQLDSDEYPYDFKKLTDFLRRFKFLLRVPSRTPVTFKIKLIVLFKKSSEGFFVISPYSELCNLVTNSPIYSKARAIANTKEYTLNYFVIHQSWARGKTEIQQKISNWGHVNDFDTMEFYREWDRLSTENYNSYRDFHPLPACSWGKLEFIAAKDIDHLIASISNDLPQESLKFPISSFKKASLYLKSLL